MSEKSPDQGNKVLDDMFASARRTTVEPSSDLLQKLNSDMEKHLPKSAPIASPVVQRSRRAGIQRFLTAWGLAGAACLGVWIGFAMPETLNSITGGYAMSEYYGIEAFLPFADLAALTE